MATIVTGAGDEHLRSDVDIGPSSLSRDLDSVGEGGGGGVGPAGSAVLRNVLVPQIGEVIDTVDVVPNVLLWKVSDWLEWLSHVINLWLSGGLSARSRWVDELEVLVGRGSSDKSKVN
jgi:hypothetical protein